MKLKFREIQSDDLISANTHINGNYNLKMDYTLEDLDPTELLSSMGLTMKKAPLKKLKSTEDLILFIKESTDQKDYDWAGLMNANIPPVVVINRGLADGIHRCILAVALGYSVSAIVFKK